MESLDSGWALVIGAVIALVGSVAAPWALEAIRRKRQARLDYRERARDALLAYQEALATFIRAVWSEEPILAAAQETHLAMARLELSLTSEDRPIVDMALAVSQHWADERPDGPMGARMQSLQIELSSAWFRGELSAAAALEVFKQRAINPSWPEPAE